MDLFSHPFSPLETSMEHRVLHFIRPAGTSRGVYQTHDVWYVRIWEKDHPERQGVGECAPLPGLSPELDAGFEARLKTACLQVERLGSPDRDLLLRASSIRFGLETAFRHLQTGDYVLWDTPFSKGKEGLPINGLIWMGPYDDMERQIGEKLAQGFTCIKLKIGAIGFEEELELIRSVRRRFSPEELTLRVDANGAFTPAEAPDKLRQLSELGIHSIEQPLKAGQREKLAGLIQRSPLPVALDEELIGVNHPEDKQRLLDTLKPHYLVLKPTLHGGWSGCEEWIGLAKERNIGWWITSALESNIGLNAVAQWCSTLNNPLHQGLGTGALYADNVDMPLLVEGEHLWYRP